MRHQSFDLRRVTAILLEQKNFGPNVIYYVFWESGGPSADYVDLEVDLKSTSGRPQVNLWYLPTHLTHLPQVDLEVYLVGTGLNAYRWQTGRGHVCQPLGGMKEKAS